MKLTLIGRSGIMDVYRRNRVQEIWVPLYVIFNRTTDRQVREFKHKRNAIRWAVANRNS